MIAQDMKRNYKKEFISRFSIALFYRIYLEHTLFSLRFLQFEEKNFSNKCIDTKLKILYYDRIDWFKDVVK